MSKHSNKYTMHVRSIHKRGRYYENKNEKIEWGGTPKGDEEAILTAKHIVKYFNDTLRENETLRELVSVKKEEGGEKRIIFCQSS